MNCVICKNGNTKQGLVTYTLERGGAIVVFKNVPAMVCENCGNFYLSAETTEMLMKKASESISKGVEFEIINLQPAA
jgi:YgiT-type zinc finger domain-containing protein